MVTTGGRSRSRTPTGCPLPIREASFTPPPGLFPSQLQWPRPDREKRLIDHGCRELECPIRCSSSRKLAPVAPRCAQTCGIWGITPLVSDRRASQPVCVRRSASARRRLPKGWKPILTLFSPPITRWTVPHSHMAVASTPVQAARRSVLTRKSSPASGPLASRRAPRRQDSGPRPRRRPAQAPEEAPRDASRRPCGANPSADPLCRAPPWNITIPATGLAPTAGSKTSSGSSLPSASA